MVDIFILRFKKLVEKILKQRKKLSLFLVSAFLSKFTIFISPILLAKYLTVENYGEVEYLLANGTIFGSLILLGTGIGKAYFSFQKNDDSIANQSFWHLNMIFGILFTISLISIFYAEDFYLLFITIGIFSFQFFYSILFQSENKPQIAVIFQSIFYLALIIILIISLVFDIRFLIESIYFIFIFIILFHLSQFNQWKIGKFNSTKYQVLLKYGVKVVLFGFLSQFICAGGRIFVEYLFSTESVGVYSFFFRISSMIPLLFYQLTTVFLFRKIFTMPKERIDTYYFVLISIVTVLAFVSYLIIPHFIGYFIELNKFDFSNNSKLYYLLVCQTVLWISAAMNEMLINRNNLALKTGIRLLPLTITYVLIIFLTNYFNMIDLFFFILINYLIILIMVIIELQKLSEIGFNLIKYRKVIFMQTILLLLIIIF